MTRTYLFKDCLRCRGTGKAFEYGNKPITEFELDILEGLFSVDAEEFSGFSQTKEVVCPNCEGKGRVITDCFFWNER